MNPDAALFQQSVDQITNGIREARGHIAEIPTAAHDLLDAVATSPPVRDLIVWSTQQIVETSTHLLDLIEQALAGAAAPLWFIDIALSWQDVRGTASGAAAALTPALMPAAHTWHGQAATAYNQATAPQHDAADRIATVAERTSTALNWCAGAGIAFYVVVGIIVVKLTVVLVTAIGLLGTAVFSAAGAALVIEEALTNTGLLLAAATSLGGVLAAQALQLGTLHGEAVDNTAFPGGHWPSSVATAYTDATVTDGDADWSLRQ